MQNISDWLLSVVREHDRKGVMAGWIEEKRFLILPDMARTIRHLIDGGTIIVLTDDAREWFAKYIILHINQPHIKRPFFPIVQISHLHNMIDSNSQNHTNGLALIYNMLDMMYSNYMFLYIGKKNTRANFIKEEKNGWQWLIDENGIFDQKDEHLDYKLLSLFKIFDKAILAAMLNQVSLEL